MVDASHFDRGSVNSMVVFTSYPSRRLRAPLWLKARSPIMMLYATIWLACVLILAAAHLLEWIVYEPWFLMYPLFLVGWIALILPWGMVALVFRPDPEHGRSAGHAAIQAHDRGLLVRVGGGTVAVPWSEVHCVVFTPFGGLVGVRWPWSVFLIHCTPRQPETAQIAAFFEERGVETMTGWRKRRRWTGGVGDRRDGSESVAGTVSSPNPVFRAHEQEPGPPPLPPAGDSRQSQGRSRASSCGCLALLGLAVLPMVLYGTYFLWLTGALRRSEAYEAAMARASENADVVASLGTPIRAGRLHMEGRIVRQRYIRGGSARQEDGSTEIRIPVSGPKGKGTFYVEATLSEGEWSLIRLEFEPQDVGERIDLLEGATPDPALPEEDESH